MQMVSPKIKTAQINTLFEPNISHKKGRLGPTKACEQFPYFEAEKSLTSYIFLGVVLFSLNNGHLSILTAVASTSKYFLVGLDPK
jgi:hypothetical protein